MPLQELDGAVHFQMVLRRRTMRRTLRLALLGALMACALAGPAQADVAYRNQTCKSQTFLILGSFSMNKPAGVVAGDVLVASMRVSSFLSFNFSTPSGWTELGNSDTSAKLYYKVAGSSEPSSYNFGSMIGVGATMVGTIVAFSGVDNADPFADSAKATGSGTTVAVPAVHAVRNGSMVMTNVTSGAGASSLFSGLTGLADACDQTGGGVSVANAFAAIAAGITASATDTLSSNTSWVAQSLMLQPASACIGGALTLSAPSSVSFPSTALDGTDKSITTTGTVGISDLTDTAVGWNLSATSTRFTNGSSTLANGATTITGLAINAGGTNCGLPTTSATTFPITLPAGATAPAAAKIYSDVVGAGLGLANLAYTFALAVPANTRIGTYTSTWTFTLASGP